MRRRILADLGIVSWQLRAVAGAPGRVEEAVAVPPPGSSAAPGAEAGGRRNAAASAPEPEPPRSGPALAATPTLAPEQAPAREEAPPASPPWSVLSLVSGATLMLLDGSASRRDLRLAMDVLGAAAGDFRSKPASRRFDWPPPGAAAALGAGADAGGRALLAFVDKDLSDHGVRRVLCTAPVAERVPALPEAVEQILVPDLSELAQDPDAKRALWRRLRSARR